VENGMIRVSCAECGRAGEFHPALAGTRVKCKGCPGWIQLSAGDDGHPQHCASCGFQLKVGRMNTCPQCGRRFDGAPRSPVPREEPKTAAARPPAEPVPRDSPAERLATIPVFRDGAGERPHRIGLAITCLHISAVLYAVLAVVFLILFSSIEDTTVGLVFGLFMAAFSIGIAVGLEFVVGGLRERKFWAWVAGLCVFGLFTPSLFFLLGILGLWGLLDADSRAEFGVGTPSER
jgi:hypothetical protein